MGYIYKITNDVNNLSYIGQTKKTINYRFKEHYRQAKYELEGKRPITHFHSAINKYGFEHFHIEVIEKCDDTLLNEREKYWINFFNTYINGYNSTPGGQLAKDSGGWNKMSTKQVIQYDLDGNFIHLFNSAAEAEEKTTIAATYIRLVCNPNTPNKTAGGFQWKYYTNNFPLRIKSVSGISGKTGQSVNQYDLKGNFLNTYNTIAEAAEATQQSTRNIAFACDKKQKRAGSFQWRYTNDTDSPPNLIAERLKKYCNPFITIQQLDKKNNLIKTWNSIIEASEVLNLDAKKIGLVCEKQQKSYSGFQWQYKI